MLKRIRNLNAFNNPYFNLFVCCDFEFHAFSIIISFVWMYLFLIVLIFLSNFYKSTWLHYRIILVEKKVGFAPSWKECPHILEKFF
ncbi:hypothetical protein BpHYR1_029595 [Brachionus plicatilis]|uniref:Uncharacterized protein n=1 Tax=Brachionus plicatilis TaxID=10195 RepID=A0A3M7SKB8_BRAPC|nr:hypothetical protein BpHYR1_029595 [Brachionus plicatilis]